MHKEVLFAIIFGSLLGLVVAYGVWRANATLTASDESIDETASASQSFASNPSNEGELSISKPDDLQVVLDSPTEVSGITHPNTIVAISSENDDYFTSSNDSGEFSEEIDLISGLNDIYVFAVSEDGSVTNSHLTVYYYEGLANDILGEDTATDSASIQERVEERLKKASTVPSAYRGTITDITENAVQIRTSDGDINQIATTDNTKYSNIVSEEKEVKAEDMAIGDYVIALGVLDNKNILETNRILIDNETDKAERKVFMADVTGVSRGSFDGSGRPTPTDYTVDTSDAGAMSTNSSDELVSIRITNVEEGDKVLVYGTGEQEDFTARTVYIFPSSE